MLICLSNAWCKPNCIKDNYQLTSIISKLSITEIKSSHFLIWNIWNMIRINCWNPRKSKNQLRKKIRRFLILINYNLPLKDRFKILRRWENQLDKDLWRTQVKNSISPLISYKEIKIDPSSHKCQLMPRTKTWQTWNQLENQSNTNNKIQ